MYTPSYNIFSVHALDNAPDNTLNHFSLRRYHYSFCILSRSFNCVRVGNDVHACVDDSLRLATKEVAGLIPERM